MTKKAKQETLPAMPPDSPIRAKLLEAGELKDRIAGDKGRIKNVEEEIGKILKSEKRKEISCEMEDGTIVTVSLSTSKEKVKISTMKPLKQEKAKHELAVVN